VEQQNQGPPPGLPVQKPFKPIEPERPKGSIVMKLFLVCLLGVGVYGGYYGYCRYKAGELEHAMGKEAMDLHQALMRLEKNIDADDVRGVVEKMAAKVGVTPEGPIKVVIEPMTDESMRKLPAIAQTAMGMAAKIPRHGQPKWIVGFKGQFFAKHGVSKRVFDLERYTWFLYVKPSSATLDL
jgi:hypothetical protein